MRPKLAFQKGDRLSGISSDEELVPSAKAGNLLFKSFEAGKPAPMVSSTRACAIKVLGDTLNVVLNCARADVDADHLADVDEGGVVDEGHNVGVRNKLLAHVVPVGRGGGDNARGEGRADDIGGAYIYMATGDGVDEMLVRIMNMSSLNAHKVIKVNGSHSTIIGIRKQKRPWDIEVIDEDKVVREEMREATVEMEVRVPNENQNGAGEARNCHGAAKGAETVAEAVLGVEEEGAGVAGGAQSGEQAALHAVGHAGKEEMRDAEGVVQGGSQGRWG